MRRWIGTMTVALLLLGTIPRAALGAPNPSDPQVETQRSLALRAVYFPFLAIGHGLLLIAKYGIAYPVYFAFKPAYDVLYESSEDPAELETSP